MVMRLEMVGPADEALHVVIDHFPFVIGRRSASDCSMPLASISRRHCQFTREADQVLVQDLSSYNGTFVNGRRALKPLIVQHGDELCLGPIQFRVLIRSPLQETLASCAATRGS